jgi:hypothetical protein
MSLMPRDAPGINAALARQRPEMLLGGIWRAEAQLGGDLGTGGRHASFHDGVLN